MAETGTAVAPPKKDRTQTIYESLVKPTDTFQARREAYILATDVRRTEMLHHARYQVASTTWGKTLANEKAQAAMAEWALANGICPVRHIDILGSSIYLKADYFVDRLRELENYYHSRPIVVAPYSRRDIPEEIFPDPKQRAKLLKEQIKINMERFALQERLHVRDEINLPEYQNTACAVLVEVELTDGRVFEGVHDAGSYGRRKKDPVGDENAYASAVTRAYRKACWAVPGLSPKTQADEVGLKTVQNEVNAERTEGSQHGALIAEIEEMLQMKVIPKDTRAYCQSIYDDWVATAFENVTNAQLLQLRDELDVGMQDMQGLDDVDVVHEDALDEDEMLDPNTGEVIQGGGLCAHCNASLDMGEPHGDTCPMIEPEVIRIDEAESSVRQQELDMLRKEKREQ